MKILTFLFLTVFTLSFAQTKTSTKDTLKQHVENQIKSGRAEFISFGIATPNSATFKKKYHIGLKGEGCVITKSASALAKRNNTIIADYLTKKYGNTWWQDVTFDIYGLQQKLTPVSHSF